MTASRSLCAVLILLLAAGAWLLLRNDEATVGGSLADSSAAESPAPGAALGANAAEREGSGSVARAELQAPPDDAAAGALAAASGQAILRLRAVDAAGSPVPAAWVATRDNPFAQADFDVFPMGAMGPGEAEGVRVTGGGDGRIEAIVPANAALIVEVGGPAQQTRNLQLDPLARGEVLDLGALALQDGGEIFGRVVAPDGAPVSGAQVSLFDGSGRRFGRPQRRAASDAKGVYRFAGLLPGGYELEADAPGFAPAAVVKVSPEAGRAPAEAVLKLREGRVLRGQVVDLDRRPIAGAEIFVRSGGGGGMMILNLGGGGGPQQQEAEAVSGADGRFLLRGLPEEGAARLTASAQGFASARVAAEAKESEVLITMAPALTLAGKLVNEKGQGVAGVEVALERADEEFDFRAFWSDRSALSGPDGAFAIDGLDPGVWRVTAHTATHAVGELLVDLTRDVDDVVARLEPAPLFSVTVTAADGGAPVAGAILVVEPQEEPGAGHQDFRREVRIRAGSDGTEVFTSGEDRAVTDAQGVAVFSELPEGRYLLRASADGFARQQFEIVRERGPQRQALALLPGANLRATVQDGASAPLPGVRVVATPKAESAGAKAAPLTRTTDAAGRAVFTGLQPGNWTVDYEAAALQGNFHFSPVARGDAAGQKPPRSRTGVEALLVPGDDAEVLLRATEIAIPTVVVTRRGQPLANAQVRLEAVSGGDDPMAGMNFGGGGGERTLADGSVRLQPVAPGDYEVVVLPGSGLPERRERAALGAGEQRVKVDVRGGRISGRAESSSGELRNGVAFLERARDQAPGAGGRVGLAIMVTDDGEGPNVVMSGGPDATRVELDAFGRYAFEEVPAGEWSVRVTATGHAAWKSETIALAEQQERDLGSARLSAGGSLRGTHLAAAASEGPEGFGANILILLDEQGRQAGMTQPKPDGSYEFRDLASGSYTLLAPPGYRSDPIEVRDGATVTHDVPKER